LTLGKGNSQTPLLCALGCKIPGVHDNKQKILFTRTYSAIDNNNQVHVEHMHLIIFVFLFITACGTVINKNVFKHEAAGFID